MPIRNGGTRTKTCGESESPWPLDFGFRRNDGIRGGMMLVAGTPYPSPIIGGGMTVAAKAMLAPTPPRHSGESRNPGATGVV